MLSSILHFQPYLCQFWTNKYVLGYVLKGIFGATKDQFILTGLFAVCTSQKLNDQTTGLVFCGLGPVWLWSFSSYETGLPNTKNYQ
jgi:hypothetical protein